MAGVIGAMKSRIDRWYVASPEEAERAAAAQQLAAIVHEQAPGAPLRTFATITAALQEARREAGPNDRIVVFGSFYTVAEALRSLR
jgi:dihydrofolate synthase/folylpolyglutamate synthase